MGGGGGEGGGLDTKRGRGYDSQEGEGVDDSQEGEGRVREGWVGVGQWRVELGKGKGGWYVVGDLF